MKIYFVYKVNYTMDLLFAVHIYSCTGMLYSCIVMYIVFGWGGKYEACQNAMRIRASVSFFR